MPDFPNATYATPTLQAPSPTFAQLQASGLDGVLELCIAANNTPIAPAMGAPAATATGSGGSLQAGAYYGKITQSNGYGETLPSAEFGPITITAGQYVNVPLPSLATGMGYFNIYLTQVGGAAGTETLYASGITGASYQCKPAGYAGTAAPPTVNTTAIGSADNMLSLLRAVETIGRMEAVWGRAAQAVSNWCEGDPVSVDEQLLRLRQVAAIFKTWLLAVETAATLIHSNSGTVKSVAAGFQSFKTRRTFP